MVKPSIAELSKGNTYNRYMLVMMAAKGAKYVTDRENYAKEHADDIDALYGSSNEIEIDFNHKPVKNAIKLFHEGKMLIKLPEETVKAMEEHDKTTLNEEIAE
ncbi:MAG: hypothetical protein IJW06_07615 [Clostridia bacterium]|nr:hypothetical protein [Clostridia bacterium]